MKILSGLFGAATAAVVLTAWTAAAQDVTDTVRALFRVDAPAASTVKAAITPANGSACTGDSAGVTPKASASIRDTLTLLIGPGPNSVTRGQQRQDAPALVSYSRGSVTLMLRPQQYGGAGVSLYTVNGRRVLHNKISASSGAQSVSRSNLPAGAYMLSVKGANGSTFATKLAHSGGKLNINVAFGGEDFSLGKQAAEHCGVWTMTLSAAAGYHDTTHTFNISAAAVTAGVIDIGTVALRALPTYSLTVNYAPTEGGTVERSVNLTDYPQGTVVTLTARPFDGYTFSNWSGDLGATDSVIKVTIIRNLTLTAIFTATAPQCTKGQDCPDDKVLCTVNSDCSEHSRGECNAVGGKIVATCQPDATQDNIDIAAVKTLVEDAAYGPAAQATVSTEAAAKTRVETAIAALALNGVGTEVVTGKFTAAVAGAVGSLSGTDGSYTFTVKLNKGAGIEAVTKVLTLLITATPYDSKPQDNADITAAKSKVQTAYGPVDQKDINNIAAARTYVNSVIQKLDLNGVTATVVDSSFKAAVEGTTLAPEGTVGSYEFAVHLTKGAGTPQTTIRLELRINATKFAFTVTVSSKEHYSGRTLSTGATGGGSYAAGTTVNINAGTVPAGYRFANWTATTGNPSAVVQFVSANNASTSFTMPASAVALTATFNTVCGSKIFDDSKEFCDGRDYKVYKYVTMANGQTWMAENLNYDTLDGTGSWCYDNKSANCNTYGRLYQFGLAMTGATSASNEIPSGIQGICPAEWHLPSQAEWNYLYLSAGGDEFVGKKLKAKSPQWNGTDNFGFSALPGGIVGSDGIFSDIGSIGYWWTSALLPGPSICYQGCPTLVRMSYDDPLESGMIGTTSPGLSVRCVKD